MSAEELLATLFQAHPWHGIAPGDPEGTVNAYIEIVPSGVVKYELDKPSGHLRVDRPQRYSSLTPSLYGFIPQTYTGERVAERCSERTDKSPMRGDGDPMDICVLSEKEYAQGGFLLHARLVGGLRMVDGDEADDKLLAVLEQDLVFGEMRDVSQVPKGLVDRLRHYFLSYKQLPGVGARKVRIDEVYGREEAALVLRCSIEDYRAKFGPPEERARKLREILGGGG